MLKISTYILRLVSPPVFTLDELSSDLLYYFLHYIYIAYCGLFYEYYKHELSSDDYFLFDFSQYIAKWMIKLFLFFFITELYIHV